MTNIKRDVLLSLVIGEVASWLILFSSKNLHIIYINYLPIFFPLLCALGLFLSYLLSKYLPVIYQLAKFILVGGLNFLIDISVLSLLIFSTGITSGFIQSGFKIISFVVAVINSFLWNKYWTFKHKTQGLFDDFLKFFIVSFTGLLINVSVDYILVNKISVPSYIDNYSWAQIGAIIAAVAALIWNFIGYKFIAFKEKE